uniref:Brinker DNA-binding domain-containing protein n=1 Tax=Ditylenchus dipsaci TaxID=166011 RepID=A0A915EAC0_9BILA
MKRAHARIEAPSAESDSEIGYPAKKMRNYTTTFKLQVIAAAKAPGSVHSASKLFRVDRKRVRDWTNQESNLRNLK